MTVVDSHCHVSPYWFEPVEALIDQMARGGVDQAVLTAAVYNPSTSYEEECLRRFPGRFSFVAAVDAAKPDAVETVKAAAKRGAAGMRMRGLKPGAPVEPVAAVLRAAGELGLAVSYQGSEPAQFEAALMAEVVAAAPNVDIVAEHLGPLRHSKPEDPHTRENLAALAKLPRIHLKIHSLSEFCERKHDPFGEMPFVEPIPPFLVWAYETFGAKRLLWGSDFPVVCGKEGYANALRLTKREFAHLPAAEQELIFGGNARRLFALR